MGPTVRELCPGPQEQPTTVLPTSRALSWFALIVKPQHERVVHDGLTYKGLESFLPAYRSARRWSDRTKQLQFPLFPGYVFCRFDPHLRLPVLRTPGVRSIVSFGSEIVPVPEPEIEQVRQIVQSGADIQPWPFLKVGQRVRVHAGPLAGLHGILVEVRSTWRVVVGVELLQRSVAVQLDRDQVIPLSA